MELQAIQLAMSCSAQSILQDVGIEGAPDIPKKDALKIHDLGCLKELEMIFDLGQAILESKTAKATSEDTPNTQKPTIDLKEPKLLNFVKDIERNFLTTSDILNEHGYDNEEALMHPNYFYYQKFENYVKNAKGFKEHVNMTNQLVLAVIDKFASGEVDLESLAEYKAKTISAMVNLMELVDIVTEMDAIGDNFSEVGK